MVLGELISFCIPCGDRAHDLVKTMPYLLAAAENSPPVEIVIIDYNSREPVADLFNGHPCRIERYEGRDHYHLAHAYNMAALASTGDYITIMGADAVPADTFVTEARKLIADGCVWMRGPYYKGILVCKREEFIAAGGYDERFEFYGGEDKELEARLNRRGSKFGLMPKGLVRTIKTPNSQKVKNYRLPLTKRQMMDR